MGNYKFESKSLANNLKEQKKHWLGNMQILNICRCFNPGDAYKI